MSRSAFAVLASTLLVACSADAPVTEPVADAGSDAREEGDVAAATEAGVELPVPVAPFILASPAFADGDTLPMVYSCDGAGKSPPLAWSGVPSGTVELVLLVTTQAVDGLKWNWVLYGIPGGVTSLSEGDVGTATAGLTSDGPALAYSPPCPHGPGAKLYTFTLYALSGKPTLGVPPAQVTGQVLTEAIGQHILASCKLTVSYTPLGG